MEDIKVTPRSPRPGECFRVKPDDHHHVTILPDAPEKGVVSDIGYHLLSDEFAPQAWADPKLSPYPRWAIRYWCQNLDGEHFIWAVYEEDPDSRAAARAAETEWIELKPMN
jgi:hypothetical protein